MYLAHCIPWAKIWRWNLSILQYSTGRGSHPVTLWEHGKILLLCLCVLSTGWESYYLYCSIETLHPPFCYLKNMLLWHNNYFELKTLEFLKFLICLKVESKKTKNSVVMNSLQEATRDSWFLSPETNSETISSTPKNGHCHKVIITPVYSVEDLFMLSKSHLFSHKYLSYAATPPSKKRFFPISFLPIPFTYVF